MKDGQCKSGACSDGAAKEGACQDGGGKDKGCCAMTHCPLTGVYIKRFALCLIAGFASIYGYDFVLHVGLLMDTYETTPQLWRTEEDMGAKFPFMLLTQALLAFITALIFTRNYECKGVGEGVRYGILLGILLGILNTQSYAWMPISSFLAAAWFFGGLVRGVGLGVIFGLLYRDPCCKKGGSCNTAKA